MKLKLITFSNNLSTVGNLYLDDNLLCHTFELPWLSNKPNISCIPAGTYTIKQVNSPKFGLTYEVCDVIGRTNILIHKGNTVDDTQGCIMPCNHFGLLSGKYAGLSSKAPYDQLMAMLKGEEHTLEIKRY